MKKHLFIVLLSSLSLPATAALYDRGNGLIYDDVLNITWLQNANLQGTQAGDSNGNFIWTEGKEWVDDLVYAGFDDWRMPSIGASPVEGFHGYQGTGELAHMFFNNLEHSVGGVDGGGPWNTSFIDAVSGETRSFENMYDYIVYFYAEPYDADPNFVWGLIAANVTQVDAFYDDPGRIWAVRNGDIDSVPVPGALWLFSSALLAVAGLRCRKKSTVIEL